MSGLQNEKEGEKTVVPVEPIGRECYTNDEPPRAEEAPAPNFEVIPWHERIPELLDRLSMLEVDCEVKFPEDTYTIIYFAPWNTYAFWYAILVFCLQLAILCLTFADMVYDVPGTEEDNWLNVPPTTTTVVFLAQFLALLIAVLSQDDVTLSLTMISIYLGAKEYPKHQSGLQDKYPNAATTWQFWCSNLLRLAEGTFTIVVSFVFIIQSETVLQIFLNFAAITFVSELDNLGHRLAEEGWFGYSLQGLAARVKEESIPVKRARNPIIDYVNRPILGFIVCVLVAANIVVAYRQSNGHYIRADYCSVLHVTFGEEHYNLPPGAEFATETRDGKLYFANSTRELPVNVNPSDPPDILYSFFSGKYEADFSHKVGFKSQRPVYYEASKNTYVATRSQDDSTVAFFYYCEGENAWVWSVRALLDAGAIPKETLERCEYGWLLRSPITQAVTLEDAPLQGWRVWTGKLGFTSDLQFTCIECKSDIDCGLNRGICGQDRQCHCHEYADGFFCNHDLACSILRTVEDGKEGGPYYTTRDLEAYGRPIYVGELSEEEYALIFYSGRRWARNVDTRAEVEKWTLERFELHAYWFGSLLSRDFWYSEPNDSYLPTGSLEWYSVKEETRSEGNYGPYGRRIQVDAKADCLSIDCSVSTRVCGSYGKCETDQLLTIGGKLINKGLWTTGPAVGGKCICDDTNYGHFCEFKHEGAVNSTNDEL